MDKKDKLVSRCSYCNRTRQKAQFKFSDKQHLDEWGYHEELEMNKDHPEFRIIHSHGVCDFCIGDVLKELDNIAP